MTSDRATLLDSLYPYQRALWRSPCEGPRFDSLYAAAVVDAAVRLHPLAVVVEKPCAGLSRKLRGHGGDYIIDETLHESQPCAGFSRRPVLEQGRRAGRTAAALDRLRCTPSASMIAWDTASIRSCAELDGLSVDPMLRRDGTPTGMVRLQFEHVLNARDVRPRGVVQWVLGGAVRDLAGTP